MHNRSAEYHISSRKDNHARTSVHRTACPLRPDPLIPEDLHLYEFTGIRSLCGQITLAVYELYEGQLIVTSDTAVVFTESRCDMNDTGTIGHGYIISRRSRNVPFSSASQRHLPHTCTEAHTPCTPDPYQHKSPVLRKLPYLLLPGAQYLVCQCLCNIIGITVSSLHLQVGLLRVHAQCHVGRKGPGVVVHARKYASSPFTLKRTIAERSLTAL